MSAPSSGWRWIAIQSSSVNVRPRSATRSDSAKCPMSCSSPAVWASSHSCSLMPTASAMSRANRATAAAWRAAR